MSESSPQLAQFLLPAASLQGLAGTPASARAGLLQGLENGRGNSSAGPIDTRFQQKLQALLDGAADTTGPLTGILSAQPGATAGTRQPDGLGELFVAQRNPSGDTPLQAPATDGKMLPEGGNVLPAPLALSGAAANPDAATNTELNARIADVSGAPLNSGRDALVRQLNSQPANVAGAVNDARTDTTEDTVANQRILPDLQRQAATDARDAMFLRSTQTSAPQNPSAVAANPVADVMSRLQATDGNRDRVPAAVGETRIAELGELAARRGDITRVTAAADSAAAQFNLHARPEGMLQPGALSAEAALRDLTAMTPLRPQTGEGAAAWSSGLGQRLLMMAENGVETARLRLNPASLGPLDIHVNVEDDQARVWFGAQNAATRDALEAALPRLREMFAEQGLQLAHADVGEQGAEGTAADADTRDSGPGAAGSMAGAAGAGDNAEAATRLWGGSDSRSLDIYV